LLLAYESDTTVPPMRMARIRGIRLFITMAVSVRVVMLGPS